MQWRVPRIWGTLLHWYGFNAMEGPQNSREVELEGHSCIHVNDLFVYLCGCFHSFDLFGFSFVCFGPILSIRFCWIRFGFRFGSTYWLFLSLFELLFLLFLFFALFWTWGTLLHSCQWSICLFMWLLLFIWFIWFFVCLFWPDFVHSIRFGCWIRFGFRFGSTYWLFLSLFELFFAIFICLPYFSYCFSYFYFCPIFCPCQLWGLKLTWARTHWKIYS